MQPLTLPEVRRIEALLREMKKEDVILTAVIERLEVEHVISPDLLIKALEMALATNEALTAEWRKYDRR